MTKSLPQRWQAQAEPTFQALQDWREQHPSANLHEIELNLDAQLDKLRAQLLQDLALASTLTDLTTVTPEQRPLCVHCQQPLAPQGQGRRTLTTKHEQAITLERSYATCPQCAQGLFPPR